MSREVLNAQSRRLVLNVLEYFQNKKETSTENISVINCAAEALKLSPRTISRIRQQGVEGIQENFTRHREAPKTKTISEAIKSEIRTIIYDIIAKKQYVTRETIKNELKNKHIINISETSLSYVLKQLNFTYKKENGRRVLMEKPDIAVKRIKFLREYIKNKTSENPLDVVFLDETWVFQHGDVPKTWQDQSTKSVWYRKSSQGKRYIVVHAGNGDGFIDGAELIFSTTNKSADYHDNMNANLFEKWLEEQLLPRLHKPSVIIMDNAKYHSRLIEKIPNSSSSKQEIIEWLQYKNVGFNINSFKCALLDIVRKHAPTNIPYAADEIIRKMGHSVLRLPPYHCQYNAIEMAWANCKSFYNKHIGQQGYDENAVLNTWTKSLENVTQQHWRECIRHTEEIIRADWNKQNVYETQPLIIHLGDDSSDDENFSDWE